MTIVIYDHIFVVSGYAKEVVQELKLKKWLILVNFGFVKCEKMLKRNTTKKF